MVEEESRAPLDGLRTRGKRDGEKWRPSKGAEAVRDAVSEGISEVIAISTEVLRNVLFIVKKPLIWGLIFYFIANVCTVFYHRTESSVRKAWCRQPISHWLGRDWCATTHFLRGEREGLNAEQLWTVQERLGEVMEKAGEGVGMARGMKSTELAVRDLVALVRISDVAGKNELGENLEGFVDGAKRAGRDLSRFTAKVAGVVDSIVAMDEFAVQALEALSGRPTLASKALAVLLPFHPSNRNSAMLKTFSQITTHMSSKIPPLIQHAEGILSELDFLEQTLITVNEIVARSNVKLAEQEQELLADLWARLFGTRTKDFDAFKFHQNLLSSVSHYRSKALDLVSSTLVELQAIQDDLAEFAVRLNEPAFMGDEVPVEVVIEGIRRGIKRLTIGRFEVEGRRRGERELRREIEN